MNIVKRLISFLFAVAALSPLGTIAADLAPPSANSRSGKVPGAIHGHVRLFGKAPAPQAIAVDPLTAKLNPIRPLATRELLVGTNGGLADVFVYVKSGLESWTFGAPSVRTRLEHRGCQLYPHVAVALTNEPIIIYNADPIPHPLRSFPTNPSNEPITKTAPPRGLDTYLTTFRHPEAFVRLQCEKHPWETAHIAVASNPFFAVTGNDGEFTINNLPPGRYLLEAVHPFTGNALHFVDLQSGQQLQLDFELQVPTSRSSRK